MRCRAIRHSPTRRTLTSRPPALPKIARVGCFEPALASQDVGSEPIPRAAAPAALCIWRCDRKRCCRSVARNRRCREASAGGRGSAGPLLLGDSDQWPLWPFLLLIREEKFHESCNFEDDENEDEQADEAPAPHHLIHHSAAHHLVRGTTSLIIAEATCPPCGLLLLCYIESIIPMGPCRRVSAVFFCSSLRTA
jgi:hypothetical protein